MKRKIKKIRLLLYFAAAGIFLFPAANGVRAQEPTGPEKIGFARVWELVKSNSPARKAASSEFEAAEIMKKRQGRHWLPRIYAEGAGYATNDPGLTFMSNMGQRSVTSSDFVPDTLNEPGTNFYQRGTIGLDLPIYEGGAGVENTKAAEKIAEARKYQMSFVNLSEFSSSASAYGQMISLLRTRSELKELYARVSSVLGNYQGGLRANPVEYSGILGLRALKNRIEAMIAENEAKIGAVRDYLDKMSGNGLNREWNPEDGDAVEFADTWLKTADLSDGGSSYMVKAYDSLAESAKSRAEAGKAVFLPKVGVYSEANVYNGERDTADSYTAGFYIKMNILSPTDYGSIRQGELESDAAKSRARDARIKADIEVRKLARFSGTLKSNIKILRESSIIMDEQIRNSQKLYASGSLRSLQLSDVFARKADLVMNLSSAEIEYVNVRSGIYNYSGEPDREVKYDK